MVFFGHLVYDISINDERRGIMAFQMPEYHQPDFSKEQFIKAPDAKWEIVEIDGVAPEYFHSTSMFPEYFKIQGKWVLAWIPAL